MNQCESCQIGKGTSLFGTSKTTAEYRVRMRPEDVGIGRLFDSVRDAIPVVSYVQEVTHPSATTYVSPQVKTLLGYEPEECTSDPDHWTKILYTDDKERVLAENRRTNETGEPFRMEYRQFANDGSVV